MADPTGTNKLTGLVLAGGRSLRMGADKGSLVYGNSPLPQVEAALRCLEQVCGSAWVSVNAAQVEDPVYARLPTIVDTQKDLGPAAGLLSAFDHDPDTAWLVLAVDMPRVSSGLLHNLIAQRDPGRITTVHCHADGTLEPLCAIWEAQARDHVARELHSGRGSLRRLAQQQNAAIARLPKPERLSSVNTPDERRAMQQRLADADEDAAEDSRGGV